MDPTSSNLAVFFTGASIQFQEAYTTTQPWVNQVAMQVPSGTNLNSFGWADKLPAMREWVGPRLVNELPTRSRTVVNKDFEITDAIDRNAFEDDQYGLYSFAAQTMGVQAAKVHDQQLSTLMQANPVCFDGAAFFGTHAVDIDAGTGGPLGTYSNDLTTLALTPTNYGAARANMLGFIGRDGKPIGSEPSLLIVPPQLEEAARVICEASVIGPALFGNTGAGGQVGSTENVWKGTCKYLVIRELQNQPKVWYLLAQSGPVKPFLYQIRRPVQFVYLINPTDANVFFNKKYIFGADGRFAYDVTIPWLAERCGSAL
jgi:phage major head subunit gpT-like protein